MQRGTCASWTGLAPAGATRRAASAPTCTAGLASALHCRRRQAVLPKPAQGVCTLLNSLILSFQQTVRGATLLYRFFLEKVK